MEQIGKLLDIVACFTPAGDIVSVAPFGKGLINDSYLVRRRDGGAMLLQRLNPAVFLNPEALMRNLRLVSDHLGYKSAATPVESRRPTVELLTTGQGDDCHFDRQGVCWRALTFIENSRTLTVIDHPGQLREAGAALGRFHHLLSDLPLTRLCDPLPGFHVIPRTLARYRQLEATAASIPDEPERKFCRRFIARRQGGAAALEQARARGILPERVIHGDPKLDNILFDRAGVRALAIIDLDTVKPGLIQYDIGDILRSCCNRAGEDAGPEQARFDLDLARTLLAGYLDEAGALLTLSDLASFYEAARLITFELGLRFFSDYLAGNRYFKVDDPGHNLRRALNQFRLVESIESQERPLRALIKELR